MSDKEQLLGMGFSEAKVALALKSTKNAGLQPALDWLIEHADDPEPAPGAEPAEDAMKIDDDGDDDEGLSAALKAGGEAKSLKCLQCGKTFRNTALASYHGDKSGHDQFEESTEEIKPLTEEEKAAKLEELRLRMLEKKKIQAKKDAEEQKANEAIRRKAGKDTAQIQADMKLKEATKEAAQRKQDKIDDAKAKAAVRAQIEADKKARAEKAAREKALREGKDAPLIAASTGNTNVLASASSSSDKKYDATRLQIRLPPGKGTGAPLVTSLPASDSLGDVAEFVIKNSAGAYIVAAEITFSSAFPRKTYSKDDWSKTLAELGLAPSAVLMVQ